MHPDLLGWSAAALMVATFSCREATLLRPLAAVTNLAFIAYGSAAGLMPVLALHLLLLPINLKRWAEAWEVKGLSAWNECVRHGPRWALTLLLSSLLVACGGGGDPDARGDPVQPLEMTGIFRQWQFTRYLGRFSEPVSADPVDHSAGGEVQASAQLGGYYLQPPRFDISPTHEIYSSASGMTYWASAESPSGFTGPEPPIGAATQFSQQQMFVKEADDATLEYVVSNVIVQVFDANAEPASENDCPMSLDTIEIPILEWDPASKQQVEVDRIRRPDPEGVRLNCGEAIRAWVDFRFEADVFTPGQPQNRRRLKNAIAEVEAYGSRNEFGVYVSDDMFEQSWVQDDFEIVENGNNGMLAYALLTKPMVIKVPLDGVKVGEAILIDATVQTHAYDFRQRESSAHAFFRDPGQVGGAELRTKGLKPVPMNARLPSLPDEDTTPLCAGGADPARGTIAFARADFTDVELPGPGARVTLVREGGSTGEVSVLLQTLDGSASKATDFVDATQRVRFRDGQTRRTVRVPLRLDREAELEETVQLRLAEPRGCAALGARSQATLTIRDDDQPLPEPARYTVGGTVSGLRGTGLVLRDRMQFTELPVDANGRFTFNRAYTIDAAYHVEVAAAPGAPVQSCQVVPQTAAGNVKGNVDTVRVECAAPTLPGSLDSSFGALGKVAQGLPGGARAIARQSTGHIVATNGARLVRYAPNGQLDLRFGGGLGYVDNLLPLTGGEVFDVAVDADDRIVVAGRVLQPGKSPPYYQMAAARLLPDGTRDLAFGGQGSGVATVRLASVGEEARRVLVQPRDARVLLVGQTTVEDGPVNARFNNNIAVVRLQVDGTLDASFGVSGAVVMDALLRDFGQAALLQPDGRVVVGGKTSNDNAENTDSLFSRLSGAGVVEAGFGRNPSYSDLDDEIVDMALQPDGRIVLLVAGKSLNFEVMLVRIHADGSLDTGFGTLGIVRSDPGPHDDLPRAVAVQADGKIVVAAQLSNPLPAPPSFGLLRFAADGTPDATFGTAGVLRVPFFGSLDSANDLLLQPDGRIVAAGMARSGLTAEIAMVRLNP